MRLCTASYKSTPHTQCFKQTNTPPTGGSFCPSLPRGRKGSLSSSQKFARACHCRAISCTFLVLSRKIRFFCFASMFNKGATLLRKVVILVLLSETLTTQKMVLVCNFPNAFRVFEYVLFPIRTGYSIFVISTIKHESLFDDNYYRRM